MDINHREMVVTFFYRLTILIKKKINAERDVILIASL